MSLFISFEGGEGSGKSTQAERLTHRLKQAGLPVLAVREPGTTPLGLYVRDWLKHGESASDSAELLLFAAARAELVATKLRPSLQRPDMIVIADRYADSTVAYQGFGRRIPLKVVKAVNDLATHGVRPDLTFLLDCPPEIGLHRVGSFQLKLPIGGGEPPEAASRDQEGTSFEEEPLDFHQRLRRGYLEMVDEEPDRWCVVDATRTIEEIHRLVWERAEKLVPQNMKAALGPHSWPTK